MSFSIELVDLQHDRKIWRLDLHDVELLAGMLACGMAIVFNSKERDTHSLETDSDVSAYRLLCNVAEDDLSLASVNKLAVGEYGLWLRGTREYHYSLFRFRSASFFQGVISICHSYKVDFRNYMYGYPFDKEGNQFALNNYVMTPYQIVQVVYDLNDIEEEQRDDENFVEILGLSEF